MIQSNANEDLFARLHYNVHLKVGTERCVSRKYNIFRIIVYGVRRPTNYNITKIRMESPFIKPGGKEYSNVLCLWHPQFLPRHAQITTHLLAKLQRMARDTVKTCAVTLAAAMH